MLPCVLALALGASIPVAAQRRHTAPASPIEPAWRLALPPAGPRLLAIDDTVTLLAQDGRLSAFSTADGKERWVHLAEPTVVPVVGNGLVFLHAGELVQAIETSTGRLRWRAASSAANIAPTYAGGWLIVPTKDGRVTALRAEDGKQVWSRDVGVAVAPVTVDGSLMVASLQDRRVVALDLLAGATRWEHALTSVGGAPLAAHAHVYLGTAEGDFVSLDQRHGREAWKQRLRVPSVGAPVADADRVYVAFLDNSVLAFARSNGALVWRAGLAGRVAPGMWLDGPRVMAALSRGDVIMVLAKSGVRAGNVAPPGPESQLLAMASWGTGDAILVATVTNRASGERTLAIWRAGRFEVGTALSAPGTAVPLSPLPPARR